MNMLVEFGRGDTDTRIQYQRIGGVRTVNGAIAATERLHAARVPAFKVFQVAQLVPVSLPAPDTMDPKTSTFLVQIGAPESAPEGHTFFLAQACDSPAHAVEQATDSEPESVVYGVEALRVVY